MPTTLLEKSAPKLGGKSQAGKSMLAIRPSTAFSFEEKEQQLKSGMRDAAKWEAWTVIGSNKDLAYATHGIFRFFGKFPPPIATHLISTYTKPGEIVWDPMSGSGTTGVEALILKRKVFLSDVSPLSLLLAKVKTTKIERTVLRAALERIHKRYSSSARVTNSFHPVGLKNLDHWFLPKTIASLKRIRAIIQAEPKDEVRQFFEVVFAAIVRRVSKATTQQGRLFLDVETALEDAFPIFYARAEKAIEQVCSLPDSKSRINILHHDLREKCAKIPNNGVDLIILHPPYFNAYKYSSINSLELVWLGHEYSNVRKSEVREYFKVGNPANVQYYVDDMANSIKNAVDKLRNDGVLAIMIGDTVLRGSHIPVVKQLLDKISPLGLTVEKIILRPPKFTEATWVASQRRVGNRLGAPLSDYLLILRKKG